MSARTAAAIAVLLATFSAAGAERKQPMEKLSTRPVQSPLPLPAIEPGFAQSPWTKICGRDRNSPPPQDVCLTVKEVRLETGSFIAGAALIEGPGQKKILRMSLPRTMQRLVSARVFVDGDLPRRESRVPCIEKICFADFEADASLIVRMKTGALLHLGGTGPVGQDIGYRLPLDGFAQAHEGPPSDPRKVNQGGR